MYICALCVPGPHGDQKMMLDPGAEITDACEPLCGCWELNLSSQQVLLTTELPHQLLIYVY